jgi:hypothetical protein
MAVEEYDIEWLQEQIYQLQESVRELQMENELLRNDLNTIKIEGCWRFVEDKDHLHKSSDDSTSGDV